MSDKKLTPRVGDRVVVSPGRIESYTTIGRVVGEGEGVQRWLVTLDHDDTSYWFPADEITVVDRQPVEWPEGWARFSSSMVSINDSRTFSRAELEDVLATGPDMLVRWDELVGGGE